MSSRADRTEKAGGLAGVTGTRSNPLGSPQWLWQGLLFLAAIIVAYNVYASFSNFARAGGLFRLDNTGVVLEQPAGTPVGWSVVGSVIPDGPAAKAGIEAGDLVRFDGPFGYALCCRAGHAVSVTIEREGSRKQTQLVAEPAPGPPARGISGLLVLFGVGGLVTTGFACALLLRSRSNRAAVLLGAILLSFGLAATRTPPWLPNDFVAAVGKFAGVSADLIFAYFWPLFALQISGGASKSGQERRVRRIAVVSAGVMFVAHLIEAVPAPFPIFGSIERFYMAFIVIQQLYGYAIIARNYRDNEASARNRIKIVVGAFVFLTLAQLLSRLTILMFERGYTPSQLWWQIGGVTTCSYAALALIVYAVVRRKLFDLNFALNRTLVYGVVSFILLASFGLAEWAAKSLVPKAWYEGAPLISAAIALALFLSFHRLRDWVEHHIERLLFSGWHENEAALRRFVGAAGHFEKTPALCRDFVQELARFSHGGPAALYLKTGDGYRLCAGKLVGGRKHYADDDRAFALLRAERAPVRLAKAHSSLPGVLALPMLDQGALAGFVLLGRKPDGTDYRPDEVAVLGWTAHQVGLTLQAQHSRELEAEVASLSAQVAHLTSQLAAAAPNGATAKMTEHGEVFAEPAEVLRGGRGRRKMTPAPRSASHGR